MRETFYLINFALVTACSLILVCRLGQSNPKKPTSRALLRWLTGWVAWAFFDLIVTHASLNYSQETAFLIYRVLCLSFVLIPGLGSELMLALVRPPTPKDRFLLYSPLVLLYISQFFIPDLVGGRNFAIYLGSDQSPGLWNMAFFLLAFCYVVLLFPKLIISTIKEQNPATRQEKLLMLISGFFVVICIGTSHWLTASHGLSWPLFGNASCVAISLAAYWIIKKSGGLFPSRSRLETIFEKTPGGFASLQHGRVMWANPGMADMLGLTGAEKLKHRQVTEFFQDSPNKENKNGLHQAIRDNQEFLEQVTLSHSPDKPITCLAQTILIDENDPNKGVFLGLTNLDRVNDLQNRLSRSESRYRALIEQAWELILVIKKNKVVFANSAALEFYEGMPDKSKAIDLFQLIHPDHLQPTEKYLEHISEGQKQPGILRVKLINLKRESIWADMVARAVDWEGGPALQVVFRNVSDRIQLEQKLEKLAATDPLTGADNRRTLHEKGQNELIRCRRYGSSMAVMMIDVDHFKNINDTMGHFVGDEVLKALVKHCLYTLRATDFFGRLGGEEFVGVLTQSNISQARPVAERLRESLGQLKVPAEPHPVRFTVSIGLTANEAGDAFFEEIVHRADKAMYLAKGRGRNQVAELEADREEQEAISDDSNQALQKPKE